MEERASRGSAVGDLDDDGRLDVVVNDLDGAPQVLRNELAGGGHWLRVKLAGRAPNTSAIGAVVRATVAGRTQQRLLQSGTSYLSQDDRRAHCGLGAADVVDVVEVTWPDGKKTRRERVKADQQIELTQAP
jgi:hypothetical protein